MKKLALLAQWAGDFEGAQAEYDHLSEESLDRGDASEVRLLHSSQVLCGVVAALEHGETDVLRVVNRITKDKEARSRDRHSRDESPRSDDSTETHREDMVQAALQAGAAITKKALRKARLEETARSEATASPLRERSKDRFISVFTHPRGLEARSYYRADVTVDLAATGSRMTEQNRPPKIVTDRLLEVTFEREVMEVFWDGRIRCISESTTAERLAKLVTAIANDLVLVQK